MLTLSSITVTLTSCWQDILKAAGHAVVMGNAAAELKTYADDLALSNDEDGVADWVEKHLLNKK